MSSHVAHFLSLCPVTCFFLCVWLANDILEATTKSPETYMPDPWNACWRRGLVGKFYSRPFAQFPSTDFHISQQLAPAPRPVLVHRSVRDQEIKVTKKAPATLSWLQCIQYTADLLPLKILPPHCWQLFPLTPHSMNHRALTHTKVTKPSSF